MELVNTRGGKMTRNRPGFPAQDLLRDSNDPVPRKNLLCDDRDDTGHLTFFVPRELPGISRVLTATKAIARIRTLTFDLTRGVYGSGQ